jgi:hypothetical protein
VRKLDQFRKFIEIAAQCTGEIVNFANIARDAGAEPYCLSRDPAARRIGSVLALPWQDGLNEIGL